MKKYIIDHRKVIISLFVVVLVYFFTASMSSAKDKIVWSKTLVLKEYMKRYVFPEELIS